MFYFIRFSSDNFYKMIKTNLERYVFEKICQFRSGLNLFTQVLHIRDQSLYFLFNHYYLIVLYINIRLSFSLDSARETPIDQSVIDSPKLLVCKIVKANIKLVISDTKRPQGITIFIRFSTENDFSYRQVAYQHPNRLGALFLCCICKI